MSVKNPSLSDVLEILEERLNCSICHHKFTKPKSLPCQHVFCHDCLGHLPLQPQGNSHILKCPVCSCSVLLPKGGLLALPSAIHCSDLVDMQQLLKKILDNKKVTCENCDQEEAKGFCQKCESFFCQGCIEAHLRLTKIFHDHEISGIGDVIVSASKLKPFKQPAVLHCPKHKKPLSIYCHTPCDQLICHDCTVRDHKDHECDPISDENVFTRYSKEIQDSLFPAKQQLAFLLNTIEAVDKQMIAVSENREKVKEEIQAAGDQMVVEYTAAVKESVEQLTQKADRVGDHKLRFLLSQKMDAKEKAAMIQSCVEYVEGEIRMSSQQQILAGKRQMVEGMKQVISLLKEGSYSLKEEPNISFIKNKISHINVGEVNYSTLAGLFKVSTNGSTTAITGRKTYFKLFLSKSTLVGKFKVFTKDSTTAVTGQNTSFKHFVANTPGSASSTVPNSLVSCQLSAPEATCVSECNIIETTSGEYMVSYTPTTSGSHQLRVKVGNVDIPGSPFTLLVRNRGTPFRTISGLDDPTDLVISQNDEGTMVISEYDNHCVTVLDNECKKIRSFGSVGSNDGQFVHPYGVAFTHDNNILVCDRDNNRLQMFNMEGNFLAAAGTGKAGKGKLQFNNPVGIGVHPNSSIFVADSTNHRVQVLNSDLTFSYSFGEQGSQPGQFCYPWFVAFDSMGMVYVTDHGNHRIQKFTPDGKFVTQFGKKGKRQGELEYPRGITVDTTTNTVYVSSGHKLSMFTIDGEFLGALGTKGIVEGDLASLYGLAFHQHTGDLYVCVSNNDIVVL